MLGNISSSNSTKVWDQARIKHMAIGSTMLRYRMAGITESAMVAYTHKYAVV